MSRKGSSLIIGFIIIAVLGVLSAVIISSGITEARLAQQYQQSSQAFWLAEAGVYHALNELRTDYNQTGSNLFSATLGAGEYRVSIASSGSDRLITSEGFVPSIANYRVRRTVEVLMSRSIPPNFYDNAIFSAGDLDINGDAYTVSGNVRYAGDFDVEHPGNITDGTTTQDNTITPLARLDFEQLYTISQAQGNVYDAGRLKEVQKDNDQFPASFWYSAPTDPNDPTTGVPNVVYITTDLQVNGNIGQIGGIFVVVGDVITDPDDTQDTTLNGNGTIDGLVYTRGEFRINGGATGLNVNGGIWAGEEARLNGSADVTYNADYMTAMQALDISGSVQISSWREGQNPYYLN